MKIALAQIEPIFSNWDKSIEKHKEFIYRAIDEKAELIVFPEMSLSGYRLKDLTHELSMKINSDKMKSVMKLSMQIDIVVGFPEIDDNSRCYITQAYCSKGEILQTHRKIFLPINGMFEDSKDFMPGKTLTPFNVDKFKMGMLICRDMWHEEAIVSFVKKDVNCLIVASNIPLRNINRDGPAIDSFIERTVVGYAEKNSIFVIYVNRVGFEEGVCFYGGSMVASPSGEIIAKLPFLEESIVFIDIDHKEIERKIRSFPLHYDRRDHIVLDAFKENF
ncbi:MAG: hypothetical protein KAH01_00655 [Caldisericia bacterium]|nr:hypothetical protein [Caldisericia bacterium]